MMNRKIKVIFTIVFLFFIVSGIMAQDPPPPPDGGHGQTGDQNPGGNAPISGGLILLLGLGAAYGGKKVYEIRKTRQVK